MAPCRTTQQRGRRWSCTSARCGQGRRSSSPTSGGTPRSTSTPLSSYPPSSVLSNILLSYVLSLKRSHTVAFSDRMEEESWRGDILVRLKARNEREIQPFQALFELQEKLLEQNVNLTNERSSLSIANERLREENLQLKSSVRDSAEASAGNTNENFLELQRKLFLVQEELTEMHRLVLVVTSYRHGNYLCRGLQAEGRERPAGD